MPKFTKSEKREARRKKKMPVSGKSVFKLKKIIEKKAQSKPN
jgi:hypothetical protein